MKAMIGVCNHREGKCFALINLTILDNSCCNVMRAAYGDVVLRGVR